jgi:hypothetical protein
MKEHQTKGENTRKIQMIIETLISFSNIKQGVIDIQEDHRRDENINY